MAPASRTRYTAAGVQQVLQYWDNFVDDSDGSDMVIEVLCNHVYRSLPFVYDHTMWTVRCQVDTVSVTGVKTVAMLWTEFPEFRHKYGQLSY